MISDYASFTHGELNVEVNWDKEVTPCKFIRFTMHGKQTVVPRDDFYGLLFLFANDKEQEDMIAVKRTNMIRVERMLHVKASKDIKKGEHITLPYRYSLSQEAYEIAVKENPRSFRRVDEDVDSKVAEKEKENTM